MTVNELELQALIKTTETLLADEADFFTRGTKLAMEDLLNHSKAVLDGSYRVPFTRSRAFLLPREDENAAYALKHLTKTPSYHMTEYGLAPAYQWLKSQHMMAEGDRSLAAKRSLVREKAKALICSWPVGGSGDELLSMLESEVDLLSGLEGETLAKALVRVYDLMRDLRHMKPLLLDTDPGSNLYYSSKEFEDLRKQIDKDKALNEVFQTIKSISDSRSLQEVERLDLMMGVDFDYEEINKYFSVWGTTDKFINFRSPKNAVKARLKFTLPSLENEAEGLGHVWIDNVKVYSESGPNWPINNGGFDEGEGSPYHWSILTEKGAPRFAWEGKAPFNKARTAPPGGVFGHGTPEENGDGVSYRSIYLENPSPQDEGSWVYDEAIDIEPDVNNTITFFAKVDGKFKKGLKVTVDFYDLENVYIESFEHYFNKKASMATGDFNLTVQTDAIVYGITGDLDYALKAKKQIQFILNDFNQGIEHWRVKGSRPDQSDAYGAVQGGRILCSLMSAYTLIKDADVFDQEEMASMIAQLEYFVRNHLDLRDRTELTPYDSQADAGNWHTDMAAGTGMLMMAIPDFPNAMQWLDNANMILRSQLAIKVKEDGSWPESIRYHFAALSRFLIYARALRNCTGENWFKDGPLVKMFAYAVDMQTPPYAYKDNLISTVPFGDHVLDGGRGFILAGNYYNEVMNYDKAVAAKMVGTWVKAGAIRGIYRGESVTIENLFAPGEIPQALMEMPELDLGSSKDYPKSGIYTFRKDYGKETESLMAIQAPATKISHGHYDIGNFLLFSHKQPLVVDLGINGYFDSSKDWLVSSSSHNVVQFSREGGKAAPQPYTINLWMTDYSARNGWVDGPRTCQVLGCDLGKAVDHIKIKIDNPEGRGHHIREIDFYRDMDVYVITDHIIDFEDPVRFSLCVAASKSRIEDQAVHCTGLFDVDLDVVFLSNVDSIELEKGRSAPQFPPVDGEPVVDILRAQSSGGQGFKTLLIPCKRGQAPAKVSKEGDGYVVQHQDGRQLILKEYAYV